MQRESQKSEAKLPAKVREIAPSRRRPSRLHNAGLARSACVHLASAGRREEKAHGKYADVGDHSVDLQAEERHAQRAMPNMPRRSSAAAANGARPLECLRAEGECLRAEGDAP